MHEFVQQALGRLAFDVLYLIDEPAGTSWDSPPERDVGDDDRRWKLTEVEPDGRPTGRKCSRCPRASFPGATRTPRQATNHLKSNRVGAPPRNSSSLDEVGLAEPPHRPVNQKAPCC